jgi:hypothetical protein
VIPIVFYSSIHTQQLSRTKEKLT